LKIGRNVFIGDEVYLESEYPEAVEIHSGVQIAVRAIVLAHTRGPGKVVIVEDVYIGPGALIVCSGGRVVTIGAGAVIGAGSVVTNDVPPQTLVMTNAAKAVAKALVPLTRAEKPEQFLRGLVPVARKNSETAKHE
jgi:acetyltransferase-like isoleucine patch superfamily enzyme